MSRARELFGAELRELAARFEANRANGDKVKGKGI